MKDIDKYVEEKAKRIQEYIGMINKGADIYWENFIRLIVEDCKPKVSRDFIGKVTARIYCDKKSVNSIKNHVRKAFEEADMEVEE